jgi:hypothetical protein
MGGISNRMKEIKRRRHRRQKLAKFETKLRKMTTGCDLLIARMGLEERKRG